MEEETAEKINFATAKSLFQRESAEPIQKIPIRSNSLSGNPKSIKSMRIHSVVEDRITESQTAAGNDQNSSVFGSSERLSGMSSSAPFDSSKNVQKINFVIPQKRGDTSDLKWLMAVHNSKPLGLHSASEKFQSDRKDYLPQESFDKVNKVTSSVNDDYDGNAKLKEVSNAYNVVVPTKSLHADGERMVEVNADPVRSSKVSNDLEKGNVTFNAKSSMTVKLNPSVTNVGYGGAKNYGSKDTFMPGFSAVLDEIKTCKRGSPIEQTSDAVTVNNHVGQSAQAAVSQQPSAAFEHSSQAQNILYLAPNSTHQAEMTWKEIDTDNNIDSHQSSRLKNWNPSKLMEELYHVALHSEKDVPADYLNMEGYLEKLPISKTKDTFLKTWKRRYFKAHNGTLHYFESINEKKESGNFRLDGGRVEDIGERILGIEDGRGHYLILRCTSDRDCDDWKRVLLSQTVGRSLSSWIKPVLQSPQHNDKRVILLELGSCSIRAGILGTAIALPQVFLPTIAAVHPDSGQRWFCFDALSPEVRAKSLISCPIKPTTKVDKYSIEWDSIPGLFQNIFDQLNVEPSQYSIMFITPTSFSDKVKAQFMDIFVKRFNVMAVNMVCQAILSLYSYNATSGVVVDIGDRIEILPIADGYVVENGVTRVPYGGQMITNAFNHSVTNQHNRFFSAVEFQIIRLVMEKLCYVPSNFESERQQFQENPERFSSQLSLDGYSFPAGTYDVISNDLGRFQSPEGLFNTSFWGLDNFPIQEMIRKAIQASPIDMRRQMWRSIYLSGGVTLLRGFPERLQMELSKFVPEAVVVQVHAAPNRYHSAYIGASALAAMTSFQDGCISSHEWCQNRAGSLQKLKSY